MQNLTGDYERNAVLLSVFVRKYQNGKKIGEDEVFNKHGRRAIRECKSVFEASIKDYIKDGFVLINRTEETATMRRGIERAELFICQA